ncbi:4-hydroxy-tetrahydrodipicolinate synthase [Rhizobium laguerreae]|uniref:4-hydroxy-tetrahydrodipicolinate synthase n=1 Tax=Rhizobium laguerreae TaxID=1076926 RepID=UPI001C902709|nr:4-hydroxy-tetrahydrodipicolinate synthase [Rhizobium laguerreae]MBY3381828.1 4-hydroxy-tetrahydrodipicolinate synthase [Rhizobium laguerreae]
MQLSGVITALVTPFNEKEDVDFDSFGKLIEDQLQKGVRGFVPLGSTGEYYAMNAQEKQSVLKFVKEVVGNRATLIAGGNAGSTREVVQNVRAAAELGYEAVLLAPPYYSLPSQPELTAHYQAVLDSAPVELVLYNYPPRVGVEVGFEVMDAFADNPRVIGVKESSGSLARAIDIKTRYGNKYQLSCGSDDVALDFLLWGAGSWICGPANCFPSQCVAIVNAFDAGKIEEAQNIMRKMYQAMSSLETGKFVQKVKYGCELNGISAGPTRMPLLPLSTEEKREFQKVFELATV